MKQLFAAVAALVFCLGSVAAATIDMDRAAAPVVIALAGATAQA